jgi:hypothetical protein
MAAINFHHASPILRVSSLADSLDYYCSRLGFTIDWNYEGVIASVSRGPCNLMLCQGDQGHPGSWVWIGVGDSEALYREFISTGATVRQPPTNFSWAYEMQVQDLDGNILRFGSEPKENVPYGPWMDMNGKFW